MTDPAVDRRLRRGNGRVAAPGVTRRTAAEVVVEPVCRRVRAEATPLLAAPGGARDRELLYGDRFAMLEMRAGWTFGWAEKDGYTGYVAACDLGADAPVTHAVAVRATHAYPTPDIKRVPVRSLSFGAALEVVGDDGRWAQTEAGFVPVRHLRRCDAAFADPAAVAQILVGTPYLWAGNGSAGLDCSGLIQAACLACAIACPGDSDQQESALGTPLDADAPVARNDLLFWRGHVALTLAPDRLIHANAHAMSVVHEDLAQAVARIEAQGDGPVTARRRLPPAGPVAEGLVPPILRRE